MNFKEQLESKRSEMEVLTALAKTEMRELNQEEQIKFDNLETEVRELEVKVGVEEELAKRDAEAAELAVKIEAERKVKEEVKLQIEESVRALTKIDAEAELNKAYAELDRAWANYYEAIDAANEAERKEEIRKLISEVLAEPSQRNQTLVDEQLETERKDQELKDAQEAERKLEEEAEEAKRAELEKENKRTIEENENKMNLFESIRSLGKGQTAAFNINDNVIQASRAAADGDTSVMGEVIPKGVQLLDILGKEPIWKQMGVDYMPNAHGTYTLPFQDPIVGAKLTELASAIGDAVTPDGTLISPHRFTVQKTFTVETINSASESFMSKTLEDMIKGCDRQITAEVYTKAKAGATEVAAGALTKDGFDALMSQAEIEYDGAFMSGRAAFFTAKGVKIDTGSGRFLVERLSGDTLGKGKTYEGVDYWYSTLFIDPAAEQYVVYGDISRIHVADYNDFEIIVDKFTQAGVGKVIITVNKVADVALLNPAAFSKTVDLDAGV